VVGVAEAALTVTSLRRTPLSRALFLEGYAALASDITTAGPGNNPLRQPWIRHHVGIFCRLFDQNRPLFSFLLLSQHTHLAEVPVEADKNVAAAVHGIFAAAMGRGDIPNGDADLLAAIALGTVAQPAIFTIYGRLKGPLSDRAGALAQAVKAVATTRTT
jgi:hypothetical protein